MNLSTFCLSLAGANISHFLRFKFNPYEGLFLLSTEDAFVGLRVEPQWTHNLGGGSEALFDGLLSTILSMTLQIQHRTTKETTDPLVVSLWFVFNHSI